MPTISTSRSSSITQRRHDKEALVEAKRAALEEIVDGHFGDPKGTRATWVRNLLLADPGFLVGKFYSQAPNSEIVIDVPPQRLEELAAMANKFFDFMLQGSSPTVAIFWDDRWDSNDASSPRLHNVRNRNTDSAVVAQQLNERLLENGFRTLATQHLDTLKDVQTDSAGGSGASWNVVRELATRQGAHIYMTVGTSGMSSETDTRSVPGQTQTVSRTVVQCKLFWTDTGEDIGTLDQAGEVSGTDGDAGAVAALRQAGELLGDKILTKVFAKWSDWAFEGRTVTITVLNCDATQAMEIKRAAEKITGQMVRAQPANDTTTLEIQGWLGSPDDLAAKIAAEKYEFHELKVVEARFHSIRMEVKN